MKILATLTYYHPHWTGLTVVARRIAEGLAARGHDVTVVCSRHDAALPAEEEVGGVRIVRVDTIGRVSRTMVMPRYPLVVARLVRDADVVHVHTPMPEAGLVAAIARARGCPVVVTHHGDVVMPAGAVNAVIKRAMDATIRAAMRLAHRVIVHTEDYRDHSVFLAPLTARIEAVYPPVELPPPTPGGAETLRASTGIGTRPVVGFAGRFVEEKGFDQLLESVPLVVAEVPDVAFVFAGDTDVAYERFFERCRPLLERAGVPVTQLGLLRDPQQMADFYAMCDVFVLPSRTDCFAIVQVEALLSGTPLVTTDIPGAREVVRVTHNGRLVGPTDPRSLADGIVEVLRQPGEYVPRRDDVRAVFDPARSVNEYERVLEMAARHRRKRRRRGV